MRFAFLCSLCCLWFSPGLCQIRTRLDTLLRLQDTRSTDLVVIRSYLRSDDPGVASRAALVAANLQDTSLIADLVPLLRSQSDEVRESAALALGQTASLLSSQRVRTLTPTLLDVLDNGPRNDRLVEECGKFGDATLLDSIVRRYLHAGHVPSRRQLMGVARFAIRGIITPQADHALLQLCTRHEVASWETVYALQRAGDQPEVRKTFSSIRSLLRSHDPLVRMNVAALAGKLRDDLVAREAIRMCLRDEDWRVRVNAARALAQWPVTKFQAVLPLLEEPLNDHAPQVVIALLNALSGNGALVAALAKERPARFIEHLDSITADSSDIGTPVVIAALDLSARLHGEHAVPLLLARARTGTPAAAAALAALGLTASVRAYHELSERWTSLIAPFYGRGEGRNTRPMETCAVLEGLDRWAHGQKELSRKRQDSIVTILIQGLESRDIAVVATAAALLADSLLRTSSALPALHKALQGVNMPTGVEAAQQLVRTLHLLGDYSAVMPPSPPQHAISLSDVRRLPDTILVRLRTNRGTIQAELYTAAAPFSVANFVALARQGFYDSGRGHAMIFHRVVPNFVVQGGDPRGDGWGGPPYAIRTEISMHEFDVGAIGMASAGKDTEGSQFFITHSPQPHLDGRYTVLGKVIKGMNAVDLLQAGDSLVAVSVVDRP